jgi:hypothetical protein
MKARLLIALAIGALVSAALLALERLTDFSTAVMSWEMPGITAAFLFWGTVGGPAALGVAIAFVVNAVVYGAAAFAVLMLFKLLTLALPK